MFRHNSTLISRRDSVRRPPHLDVLPCDQVITRHLHILPALTSSDRPVRTVDTDRWLSQVETHHPVSALPKEPKMAPALGMYEVPKGVQLGGGPVLLRIGRSQMGWEERNYQVIVRLGEDSVLSCPTGKSGCLQDYFLL